MQESVALSRFYSRGYHRSDSHFGIRRVGLLFDLQVLLQERQNALAWSKQRHDYCDTKPANGPLHATKRPAARPQPVHLKSNQRTTSLLQPRRCCVPFWIRSQPSVCPVLQRTFFQPTTNNPHEQRAPPHGSRAASLRSSSDHGHSSHSRNPRTYFTIPVSVP